jgi:hypothetical protein
MKTQTVNTFIAAFIVLAVITFIAIAMPSVIHNVINDIITKR